MAIESAMVELWRYVCLLYGRCSGMRAPIARWILSRDQSAAVSARRNIPADTGVDQPFRSQIDSLAARAPDERPEAHTLGRSRGQRWPSRSWVLLRLRRLYTLPAVWYWVLLSCSVVLPRVAWILAMPVIPFVDFQAYDQHAWRLALTGMFTDEVGRSTAYWPVGYVGFLAGLYAIFGHSLLIIRLTHVALHFAAVVLVYLLGREIAPGAARPAGLMLAWWPSVIGMSNLLASENLFLPLLLLSVYLYVVMSRRSLIGVAASGIALGLAALTRPVPILLPFSMTAIELIKKRPNRNWLVVLAFQIAGMALVIGPWAYRNAVVMHSPILVSTNGGLNLWMGMPPHATGGFVGVEADPKIFQAWHSFSDEGARDRYMYRQALHLAFRDLPGTIKLIPRKLFHLFSRDTWSVGWAQMTRVPRPLPPRLKLLLGGIAEAYYVTAMGMAVLALADPWVRRVIPSAILAVIVYWIAVHLIYFGEDRFHTPIVPLVAVLASLKVATLVRTRVAAPDTPAPTVVGVGV